MGWEILVKVVVVFVVVNVVVFVVKCIICEFFVRNTVMQYLYVYLSSLDIIYIYISCSFSWEASVMAKFLVDSGACLDELWQTVAEDDVSVELMNL